MEKILPHADDVFVLPQNPKKPSKKNKTQSGYVLNGDPTLFIPDFDESEEDTDEEGEQERHRGNRDKAKQLTPPRPSNGVSEDAPETISSDDEPDDESPGDDATAVSSGRGGDANNDATATPSQQRCNAKNKQPSRQKHDYFVGFRLDKHGVVRDGAGDVVDSD